MKQIEFRGFKELLTITDDDKRIPDEYVAVWVDRKVLDELICFQTVDSQPTDGADCDDLSKYKRRTLSALIGAWLTSIGHDPRSK